MPDFIDSIIGNAPLMAIFGGIFGGVGVAYVNKSYGHKGLVLKSQDQFTRDLLQEVHDNRNKLTAEHVLREKCERDHARTQKDLAVLEFKYAELKKDFDELTARFTRLQTRIEGGVG